MQHVLIDYPHYTDLRLEIWGDAQSAPRNLEEALEVEMRRIRRGCCWRQGGLPYLLTPPPIADDSEGSE